MRYLAVALLAPLWLILCWGYWNYPKTLPHTLARRAFDAVAVLLAFVAAVLCALFGFDSVALPAANAFGLPNGAIWQQVRPALFGYGVFSVLLFLAMALRHVCWRRR
ncbi:MAG: hypothetical protein ABI114_15695 [Rhodanobacter sp.]